VQFKQGGRRRVARVTITLYGGTPAAFDQIYGADLNTILNPAMSQARVRCRWISKPIRAAGLIPISTSQRTENPVHLTTTNLLFNQKTETLHAGQSRVRIPQANGSAIGLSYVGRHSQYLRWRRRLQSTSTIPLPYR